MTAGEKQKFQKEQFRNVGFIILCIYQNEHSDSESVMQIVIKPPQENAIYALIYIIKLINILF